ncbi:MAG: MFS transporter [Alphaproteobacteria bacterium]|nr:MFS transporter [Alphaproteobacteria bacterium]
MVGGSGGALAHNAVGGPAARPLGQYSWAFFDWANQPYFTIVGSLIFGPYFATFFIADETRGQEILGYTLGLAGLVMALLSPVAGAISDAAGRRKPWMAGLSAVFVLAALAHWWAVPGAPDGIWHIALAVALANVTLEMAVVFNNSMLPTVAPANRLGFLSGFGYGIGYVGGIVALLLLQLAFFLPAEDLVPWPPLFGIGAEGHAADRLTGPFSAIWYLVFVLPMFLFTPDVPARAIGAGAAIREGLGRLWATLRKLRRYGNIVRFLIARMIFNDGLNAIFVFGPVYAAGLFGWKSGTLSVFGLLVLIFWAVGAFAGGVLDDRLGPKRTLYISLAALMAGSLLGLSLGRESILFGLAVPGVEPGRPLGSLPEQLFLFAGIIMGLGAGPAQSASRSLMARLAPDGMLTEFFGLYALSGKAAAFLAPVLIAVLTGIFDSLRPGLVVIIALLAIGLVLLLPVRIERADP